MAHDVGVVALASGDKCTSYSKHARMAMAYQLVLVHCGITTVASSLVDTRRRRTESRCCTGGTKNVSGCSDSVRSDLISVDCEAFGHAYV